MRLRILNTVISIPLRVLARAFRPQMIRSWFSLWGTAPVASWISAAEYFREGNFRSAAALYQAGLERHPRHPARAAATLDYAFCLNQLGERERAAAILNGLLREAEPPKEAFRLLASINSAYGNHLEAWKTLRTASFRYSDDLGLRCEAIAAQCALPVSSSQFDLLQRQLAAARERIPLESSSSIKCDFASAILELKHGDSEHGEQLLSRVLATGDAPIEALLLRAERWINDGRHSPAREVLNRVLRSQPRDVRALTLLARSELSEGEGLDLALLACRESDYRNRDALSVLAACYHERFDPLGAELITARLRSLSTADAIDMGEITTLQHQLESLRTSKLQNL